MTRKQIGIALVMMLFVGCGGGDKPASAAEPSAAAPKPAAAPTPAPAAEKPAAPPSNRIDDPSFELVAQTSGTYASGKLASFAIALTPRGEYHVNQEYPISISLHADDGVSLAKSELAKADAAAFGEKAARFDVPFTPQRAGEHHVEAKVRFAVCTAENCVPDERMLALNLPVQ